MERMLLARHAESEYSLRGAVNGDPAVAVALSPAGREQARRLRGLLAAEPIELCVTSEFARTRETADAALAARDVPRLVLPGLNDIRVGSFEGGLLEEYRAWARAHGPEDVPPGAGESRAETVRRYVRAYRELLTRPEGTILVVTHGLPIRYVLNARGGIEPQPALDQVPFAQPFAFSATELESAVELLERWAAAPVWR